MSLKVDDTRLNQAIGRYVAQLRLDGREVIRTQMRLLLQQSIKFTPPNTLAQGRKAVARDIQRAVQIPTPDGLSKWIFGLRDENLRNQLVAAMRAGDRQKFDTLFRIATAGHVEVVGFDPHLHQSARNRRGRVTRRWNRVSIQVRQWNAYIKKVQARVGLMRSGWLPALRAVGGTAAAWIARHSTNPGNYQNNLSSRNPSFTATNIARGIGNYAHHYRNALRARLKAIEADLKHRLRKNAQQCGF
jgi:hypothetical protein